MSWQQDGAAARPDFRASADELLAALFVRYQNASEAYFAEPTPARWLALVRAHAAWRVALGMEGDPDAESN